MGQPKSEQDTRKQALHRCTFCPRISHTHTHTHTHTLSLCSGPRWRFRVSTVVGDICSAFVCECHNQKAMLFISNLWTFLRNRLFKRFNFFLWCTFMQRFPAPEVLFCFARYFFPASLWPLHCVNQWVNVWLVSMVQLARTCHKLPFKIIIYLSSEMNSFVQQGCIKLTKKWQ